MPKISNPASGPIVGSAAQVEKTVEERVWMQPVVLTVAPRKDYVESDPALKVLRRSPEFGQLAVAYVVGK
jgi:hypothetical protein